MTETPTPTREQALDALTRVIHDAIMGPGLSTRRAAEDAAAHLAAHADHAAALDIVVDGEVPRCEHGMALPDLCLYAEQVANGEGLTVIRDGGGRPIILIGGEGSDPVEDELDDDEDGPAL